MSWKSCLKRGRCSIWSRRRRGRSCTKWIPLTIIDARCAGGIYPAVSKIPSRMPSICPHAFGCLRGMLCATTPASRFFAPSRRPLCGMVRRAHVAGPCKGETDARRIQRWWPHQVALSAEALRGAENSTAIYGSPRRSPARCRRTTCNGTVGTSPSSTSTGQKPQRHSPSGSEARCCRSPGESRRLYQGCSTLFEVFHLGKGFDPSESGGVSILGDGVGLIEAGDIVGEAA
jgi:hypothetical protein